MLNQITLVGRLVKNINLNKTANGKKVANLTLAIPRSFKNMEGIYETDFVDCTLWDTVAVNTKEYCHKGDIIGVRGRVESYVFEQEDYNKNELRVVAEKITFLSSKPKEDVKVST